ncbi:LysR family transcriptional regulator [Pantoea dispersa]
MFARAAERLNSEQPQLSKTIKKLEVYLGIHLFVRGNHSTRLTRAVKLFLEHLPCVFTACNRLATA